VIRTDTLGEPERWELVRAIHPIHSEVTEGVSVQALYDYVDAGAEEAFLGLVEDADGETVGFMTLHLMDVELDGRPSIVLRAAPFMRSDVIGGGPTSVFALWSVLHIERRWPGRPMVFFSQMVSPAPYAMTAKFVRTYPGPDAPTPAAIERLRDVLIERFGYEPVPDRPWITRGFARPPADFRLRRTSNPYVRFFLDRNPDFMEGHALTVVVPLDARNVASLAVRLIRRAVGL
jgi:hypothetical protein